MDRGGLCTTADAVAVAVADAVAVAVAVARREVCLTGQLTANFRVTASLRTRLGSLKSRAQDKNNETKFAQFGARTTENAVAL